MNDNEILETDILITGVQLERPDSFNRVLHLIRRTIDNNEAKPASTNAIVKRRQPLSGTKSPVDRLTCSRERKPEAVISQ